MSEPESVKRHINPKSSELHFTENTLFKVYDALREANLSEQEARDAINNMQNMGILFRERVDTQPTKHQTCRSAGNHD